MTPPLTLNIRGHLINLKTPKVMGILNVTPDSFYSESRKTDESSIRERVVRMKNHGVDIIDVGGCSTRPGYAAPSPQQEWERVRLGCRIVREEAPQLPLSIDTFRAEVARLAIEDYEADIINDISGGKDPEMWHVIADNHIGYVLTHNESIPDKHFNDVSAEVITDLSKKVNELHRLGVNDVIIDPGFGFGKTVDENFTLLKNLEQFTFTGLPVLVGISRKSMVYNTLHCKPQEALNGTTALNAVALIKGANILRVHDVSEAVEAVRLLEKIL